MELDRIPRRKENSFIERGLEPDAAARRKYRAFGFKGVPAQAFDNEVMRGFYERKTDELCARMQQSPPRP